MFTLFFTVQSYRLFAVHDKVTILTSELFTVGIPKFYSSLFFERVRATSMTQRRAENTLANLFHFRLYRLIRLTRSIIENRRSGVGMSGTLVPMSTGRPAGTHQNFIILGTAGYRVP